MTRPADAGLRGGVGTRLGAWIPSGQAMPGLLAVTVVAGLALILLATPIVGRGDYGQWLMTSRFYLGESVPDYRTIPALPPLVPVALALIQLVVPDPVVALQLGNALLMVGLAASLYAAGSVLGRDPVIGLFSVVIGLLVTDRLLELFAFGGLLQSSAVMFTAFSVAALARAGRGPGVEMRWWVAGSLCLALAALSHVGSGTVAVPTGVAVAGISLFRLRHLGWPTLRRALVPVLIGLGALAIYWVVVLLPAGRDYVTNPASLGYRGPERLFSALFDFWPTGLVIVVGAGAIVVGVVTEALRRDPERWSVLAAWAGVAWGSLAVAVVTGAATDFPRFAPVLLAPLVVATALVAGWAARRVAAYLHEHAPDTPSSAWLAVVVAAAVLVAIPFAVERYQRQAQVYQPRAAEALAEAVAWIDTRLAGTDLTVLTAVRDGKWLEGATGREALFSLPVRYAFRPTEWERSVDAETLLRSSAALTNGYFFVKFTDQVAGAGGPVPIGMLLGVNHGGEFVELLRLTAADTRIHAADGVTALGGMTADAVRSTAETGEASIRTDWHGQAGATAVSLARSVRLLRDGATLMLADTATAGTIENVFTPPQGMAVTDLSVDGREVHLCFTQLGSAEPCLRIWAVQPGTTFEALAGGSLRVQSTGPQLEMHVTALTAGGPSVDLEVLDPATLISRHRVGAALLVASDPSYAFRVRRLEALGFREMHRVGPYAVLVREDLPVPEGGQ